MAVPRHIVHNITSTHFYMIKKISQYQSYDMTFFVLMCSESILASIVCVLASTTVALRLFDITDSSYMLVRKDFVFLR